MTKTYTHNLKYLLFFLFLIELNLFSSCTNGQDKNDESFSISSDNDDKVFIDYQFEEILPFSDGMAGVRLNNKWGYIDTMGNIVIDCEYSQVDNFDRGISAVKKEGLWYFIDKSGEIISPDGYDKVNYFDSLVKINKGGKWGTLDFNMNEVTPYMFSLITVANESRLIVENEAGLKGISDYQGEEIIPAIYLSIVYSEEMFLCRNENYETAFFDLNGKQITQFSSLFFGDEKFKNGKIAATTRASSYLYDKEFNVVYNGSFNDLSHSHDDLYIASIGPDLVYGVYNISEEKWQINPAYPYLYYYENGYWAFSINSLIDGPWGIMNESGDTLIEPVYDGITIFDNIAIIEKSEKEGFYSFTNDFMSEISYDEILYSDKDLVLARNNEIWSVLNSRGDVIYKDLIPSYNIYAPCISNNLVPVKNSAGLWGFDKVE